MSRFLNSILAVAIVSAPLVLAGCKSDEEKAIGMMEEMADIIDKNKSDCDKAAAELTKWKEANGAEMKKMAEKDKGKSKEDQAKLMEKYKDRIEAALKKTMDGTMKCMSNEKFAKAAKMD